MKYIRYTEYNDHEGETWHRFIPTTDPNLLRFIGTIDGLKDPEGNYTIEGDGNGDLMYYDEGYVNTLVKESKSHMNAYMEVYAIANINEAFFEWAEEYPEDIIGFLYKMEWVK